MFTDCLRSTKVVVPAGICCITSGLFLVLLGALSSNLVHSSQTSDFFRGFAIGAGIVVEIIALAIMLLAVKAAQDQRREHISPPSA
jgi:hypothetical protein